MSSIKIVRPESLSPFSNWKYIGGGHFGAVFKVKHNDFQIHVAVKKLKDNASHLLKELHDEAIKIKHASENSFVVPLFGIVKEPPCIVMEWMEYGCLGTLMEKVKEIPWALKYRILHEVALGMNWLHRLTPPLLHLDLKPRNVLLNDSLHIKLADFGLSKYTSSSTSNIDEIGGTLEYMPPEAFQEGYTPSKATDIYSFAILSAVILRGDDPYPAVHCTQLLSIHVPQGQRPSFDSLKNISSVKNLDQAIALTELCWKNDKQLRPHFDECCKKWEKILSAYGDKEIKDAVQTVLTMMMDCTDSSGSRTDAQQSASVPNTRDMSDMIRQMQTINITEAPSALQEAVPSRNKKNGPVPRLPQSNPTKIVYAAQPSAPNYKTGPPPRNSQIMQNQYRGPRNTNLGPQPRQMGPNSVNRTGNMMTPWPFPWHSPGPSQINNMIHNNSQMPFGPPGFPSPPHFMPEFQHPPQSSTASKSVVVMNNTGAVQIGDNNSMVSGVARYPPNTRNNPPHPERTRPASYPSSQVSYISVTGNKGPLQIGDGNKMFVGRSQGSNLHPIPPRSGQTAYTSSHAPEQSTQPTHPTPASLPTKKAGAFSDATQPTQETARQTDQLLQRTTTSDTTVSNSLPGKDNNNSSSSPQAGQL